MSLSTFGAALISWKSLLASAPASQTKEHNLLLEKRLTEILKNVDPMIGTGWRGHMFPGPVVPFGLVQLSPDTSGPPEPRWNARGDYTDWEHCSGYHYPDDIIMGFSHTHVQGTGGKDLGDILLMPLVEDKNWFWNRGIPSSEAQMQIRAIGGDTGWVFGPDDSGYRSYFSHEREVAKAGYYSVHLDTPDVKAELTATARCGVHRYDYQAVPSSKARGLILDLTHGLNCRVYQAALKVESASRFSGMRSTHGWAKDRSVYFVIEFSQPAKEIKLSIDGQESSATEGTNYSGEKIKTILSFASDVKQLIVRVGISGVSIEGARQNLREEITTWEFDAIVTGVQKEWAEVLSVAEVQCTDTKKLKTFYTSTYHSLIAPAVFSDVDGQYRGQDRKNHPNEGFKKYTTLSIWDIYRGQFPFLTITQPQRINDIVRTLLADYQQLGLQALPMWPLWGNETWSMNGFHAAGMILAAYVRGFRDFDLDLAYKAIYDTALVGAEVKGERVNKQYFRERGYIPMDLVRGNSVSATLDVAYDYWCAGAFAELLNKTDDAKMFYKFATNYRSLYDPSTGFMRGKKSDGSWRDPFRPDEEYDEYVESNAWQASFSIPHDVEGLIALHGGDQRFIDKLEELFHAPSQMINARPDVTGMVGQNAQGNEPSNVHPYLFVFAGAPWKTQYWVRKVMALYNNTPAGVPGNDDCGQLSCWWSFGALGFYPVNAANGVYVIGSPLVDRAVLKNPITKTRFEVVAEGNSSEAIYIQRAQLNGKDLNRAWITHEEIAAGGNLHFQMGLKPNREWGSAADQRPPSKLLKSHM